MRAKFGKPNPWCWVLLMLACGLQQAVAAPFGKVVAIGGHAADLALDEARRVLYIANFTANRIDVMSLGTNKIQTSINVAAQPSSIAVSPDGRYLVVAHFGNFQAPIAATNSLTVIDLTGGGKQTFAMSAAPLGVAFGIDNRALVVTTSEFLSLDPSTGSTQTIDTIAGVTTKFLPTAAGNFPSNIVASSMATSGDGLVIYGIVAGGSSDSSTIEFRYDVNSRQLRALSFVSQPPLGPRVASVNRDGSRYLAGWTLNDAQGILLAQFPSPSGILNIGSHAIDSARGVVYAQMTKSGASGTAGATDPPILQLLDSDNLAVIDRFQLAENLSGKSVLSSDGDTMYSVSDSGVTIFPVGALNVQPRVAASQRDLVFRGNFCDRQVSSQQVTILDPGGNRVPFTLSSTLSGISFSPSSGVTPATITVRVDPTVFQNQKGTVTGNIDVKAPLAINLPAPIRVLVNNKEPDQRGVFLNVPGKLVDILADPARDRFFVLSQDTNQVLVFDGTSYTQTAALKTGNTPTQMAITFDRRYLLVGHDNSQFISVFDLETLQPSPPVIMPLGHYPRSIASSGKAVLVANRVAGPNHVIDRVDMNSRTASAFPNLGVYENKININTVLVASGNGSSILVAQADGNVLLYNANVDTFTVSRKDSATLAGAYAASSYDQFVAGSSLLNASLVPIRQFDTAAGQSSGFSFVDQFGFRTTAPSASSAGIIQRVDLQGGEALRSTRMAEAPLVGDSTFPFTRTLAPLYSRQAIVSLTSSGITVLPWNYDASVASPSISRIVNVADFTAPVAPGSLITLEGSNLSPVNQASSTTPLPTALGESCLTVNGQPVPMFFVSPERINAQMPYQLEGNVTMILRTPGGVSDNYNLSVLPAAPSIFRTGTAGPETQIPTLLRARNNELVTISNPIHREDRIVIYLTGMGNTTPAVEAGVPATADPSPRPLIAPSIRIGNVSLPVEFAGLAPDQIGVYQINVFVPRNVPTGFDLPFTVDQGGQSTQVSVRVVE